MIKYLFTVIFINIDWTDTDWSYQLKSENNGVLNKCYDGNKDMDITKPFYIDPTLVKINWTDSNDGWNDFARLYWTKAMIIDHYQRKIMPKFTKLGYAKMKIPEKLLDVILQEKSKNSVPEGTRNSRIPISSVVYAYKVSLS